MTTRERFRLEQVFAALNCYLTGALENERPPCEVGGVCESRVVIERTIDFNRLRHMRCGACSNEWPVDAVWLNGFDQGEEPCPECGTDCMSEDRPHFWTPQGDPAYDDSAIRDLHWYHTSTHSAWPDRDFDPSAYISSITKQRLQSIRQDGRSFERWAKRQSAKALHVGTYEAAIENMFRRIRDQGDLEKQFYLYRVRISADAPIHPGVHHEASNWVGDVQLSTAGGPDIDVFRYVNTHEDPSSVSLAVTIGAISAVQGIPVPVATDAAASWTSEAAARMTAAARLPSPQPKTAVERMARNPPSALYLEARKLERELAGTLPIRLRERFRVGLDEERLVVSPEAFIRKLAGMVQLVNDPQKVLALLNLQPWREL